MLKRTLKRSSKREEALMKAVVLTDYGDVDKLELREMPDPRPARTRSWCGW